MHRADVVIVGAGIVGCAVAHALSRAGHSVRVFDARAVAGGATQASAGVLAPHIEGHDSDVLTRLGQRSLDLFDSLVEEVGADPPVFYERPGTLEVAFDVVAATRLQRAAAALGASGIEAEWLDAGSLASLEPAVGVGARGALLVPRHGYVAVAAMTAALAASAARHGARFEHCVQVCRITATAAGVRAVTANGHVDAETVVLAAGSWSGQIAVEGAAADVPVTPIRGQLLQLALPSRRFTRVVWGPHCYLVPWPDGSVLVGATMEDVGFDERATVVGVTSLLEAACALVPELSTATFVGVRVGLRPAGPDGLPMVGRSVAVPGLIYATGHFRNGVLLAPLTAALVAGMIEGASDDPDLALLDPQRVGRL